MIDDAPALPYEPAVLPDGREMTTLGQVLRARAAHSPEAVAVRTADRSVTFAQLAADASRIGAGLTSAGLRRGDRVAVLGPHDVETLAAIHGCTQAGLVPAVVNHLLASTELAEVLESCGPAAILLGDFDQGRFPDEVVQGALVVGRTDSTGMRTPYAEHFAAVPAVDPGEELSGDDTALMLFTSGTTGRPKGIELTGRNLAAQYGAIQDLNELGPDSVAMAPLPFFHIAGLGYAVLATLNGATLLMLPATATNNLAEVWESHGVSHAIVVPALLQALVRQDGIRDRDWSALRYLTYGASAMSVTLMTEAREVFGCRFLQGYGLTETTGGVTMLSPDDHDRSAQAPHRLRSVGRVLRGSAIAIVDPHTLDEVPVGTHGEVLIAGHQVMAGYASDGAANEAARIGSWFRSGDIGSLDEDGFLYLHDRLKDMIISGGENIYPAEVERVLASLPGVLESAVIAIPSERWGESPYAVVVKAPDAELSESDVLSHCQEHLARFKCPVAVEFVTALPRNATGKVRKNVLRTGQVS